MYSPNPQGDSKAKPAPAKITPILKKSSNKHLPLLESKTANFVEEIEIEEAPRKTIPGLKRSAARLLDAEGRRDTNSLSQGGLLESVAHTKSEDISESDENAFESESISTPRSATVRFKEYRKEL